MNFQNIETEDFKSQQPLAFSDVSENSLSDSCNNGEETDKLPPVEAFTINKTTWDLVDIIGNQDSWIRNAKPNVPMGEKVDLQDGSLGSLHSSCSDLTPSEGAEPLKSALSTVDVSWSSPEVVRRDSTLEPLPSLPVTPCLDASLSDRTGTSLLQADQQGLLCSPGESAAAKAPCWAESPSAADRAPSADPHVRRTAVVGGTPWVLSWVGVQSGVPMGLSVWLVVSQRQHCWFTSCQAYGRVWAGTSVSCQLCVGTVSSVSTNPKPL